MQFTCINLIGYQYLSMDFVDANTTQWAKVIETEDGHQFRIDAAYCSKSDEPSIVCGMLGLSTQGVQEPFQL